MFRLVFSTNREIVKFVIIDRSIYYSDRKIVSYVRCLPKPDKLLELQKGLSRLFEFTEEELNEYAACKTEADIVKAVERDAGLKGCRIIIKKEAPTTDKLKDVIKGKEIITNGFS
jgi:hypothetical protein